MLIVEDEFLIRMAEAISNRARSSVSISFLNRRTRVGFIELNTVTLLPGLPGA